MNQNRRKSDLVLKKGATVANKPFVGTIKDYYKLESGGATFYLVVDGSCQRWINSEDLVLIEQTNGFSGFT